MGWILAAGPAAYAAASRAVRRGNDFRINDAQGLLLLPEYLPAMLAKNPEHSPGDIFALVEDGTLTVVVIVRDGVAAGLGLVQLHVVPTGTWLHDAHVWIFPEFRRLGLYSAYIGFLKRWAAREGWLGVKCLVHADEDEEIWQKTLPALGGRRRTVEYVFPVSSNPYRNATSDEGGNLQREEA